MILFAKIALILLLTNAVTVEVPTRSSVFGDPVVSGNAITFPDTQYGGFGVVGVDRDETSIDMVLSPPGQWRVDIEGGDWGLNRNTLTVNGVSDVQDTNSGHWVHSVTAQLDADVRLTSIIEATSDTEEQYNSIGVNMLTLTYLPASISFTDYVDWRKNDGTLAGYEAWRGGYGSAAAVCEPRCLWVMLLAALNNRARRS